MSEGTKQKVTCVVTARGQVISRHTESKEVFTEGDRRFVVVNGLRYRLDPFNEYEMAYLPRTESYTE